jgi:lipopolysaccharide export system permease protein
VLLATLFSVSILARRNEFLAMKASGISLYRVTLPYILAVSLLAGAHFYYNEYIFPTWNQKRLEIKEFVIERRSKKAFTIVTNAFRQIKPGYYYTISSLDVERNEGKDIKVYKTADNKLKQFITAPIVIYENFQWKAKDGILRYFDDSSKEQFTQFKELELPDIVDKPEDLAKKIGKPEDMGYDQLKDYIQLMKRVGVRYTRESIDLGLKVAYPLTSIIVVLIAIPFAANPRKGGIAVSFALGATISLSYFVLFRILQSAGNNEKIPQEVAVWGVNGLFLLTAIIIYWRVRK